MLVLGFVKEHADDVCRRILVLQLEATEERVRRLEQEAETYSQMTTRLKSESDEKTIQLEALQMEVARLNSIVRAQGQNA